MIYTLIEKTSPNLINGRRPVISEILIPEWGLRIYRNGGKDYQSAQADVYRGEKHLRTPP